jgi:uncharacterized protein (DUF2236 family)
MLPRDDEALLALAGIADPPPPETGLFRADSWLRRVSAEPVLLLGGGRALLLEVAHPLVAAGVARHSRFREDPLGRLQRTLDAMSTLAFRERAVALEAARRVEQAHAHVRGRLERAAGRFAEGAAYDGRDPELMRWVWATLVDTALVMTERFVAPLGAGALEAYYGDQRTLARVLGIPDALLPAGYAEFRAYFDGMLASDALAVTDAAREIAAAVLDPPLRLPTTGVVRLVTAGLLPPRLREEFGLRWDASREARLEALCASARALRAGAPPAATGSLDAPAKAR